MRRERFALAIFMAYGFLPLTLEPLGGSHSLIAQLAAFSYVGFITKLGAWQARNVFSGNANAVLGTTVLSKILSLPAFIAMCILTLILDVAVGMSSASFVCSLASTIGGALMATLVIPEIEKSNRRNLLTPKLAN